MRSLGGVIWRALVGALLFCAALVVSRLLLHAAGLGAPRMPTQAPEDVAVYYLGVGALLVSVTIAPLSAGLSGRISTRWLALSCFVLLGFAVSTTIESSIYSETGHSLQMVLVLTPACILVTGFHAVTSGSPVLSRSTSIPWQSTGLLLWLCRALGAVVGFVGLYFVFGLLASPFVTEYYESGVAGFRLPKPSVILGTELLRGLLHVLATIPILVVWRSTRLRLTGALSVSFFIFVFAYDVVLANQLPPVLAVVHGIEVLVKSIIYGYLLVSLLVPGKRGFGSSDSA